MPSGDSTRPIGLNCLQSAATTPKPAGAPRLTPPPLEPIHLGPASVSRGDRYSALRRR